MTNDERLKAATDLLQSEPDTAHKLCLDVLKEDPENVPANVMLGVISCRAERYGAALAFFARACELKPQRAEMWNNLGTVYHELKKPAKAREYFQRAQGIREDAMYLANIGVTYSDEGNSAEALKWIQRAEKMGDVHGRARILANPRELPPARWREGAYEGRIAWVGASGPWPA